MLAATLLALLPELGRISPKAAIAGFYDRLRRAGKARKAIVASMRKLLTILNAIARDQQPWFSHA